MKRRDLLLAGLGGLTGLYAAASAQEGEATYHVKLEWSLVPANDHPMAFALASPARHLGSRFPDSFVMFAPSTNSPYQSVRSARVEGVRSWRLDRIGAQSVLVVRPRGKVAPGDERAAVKAVFDIELRKPPLMDGVKLNSTQWSLPEDATYLRKSRLVWLPLGIDGRNRPLPPPPIWDIDPTKPLASSLGAKLRKASPFDTVNAILAEMAATMKYGGSGLPPVRDYRTRPCDSEEMLRRRSGICHYWACAFVALARAAGVPARYVSGYMARLPEVSAAAEANYNFGHALAEVWLDGAGWVRVEPQAEPFVQNAGRWTQAGADPPFVRFYVGHSDLWAVFTNWSSIRSIKSRADRAVGT